MSVENKIKELLARTKTAEQQLTEESHENLAAAGMSGTGAKAASNMSKDTSKAAKAGTAGDTTQPKQGSSKDASFTTSNEDDGNLGAKNASSVSKDTSLPKSKGDAKSATVSAMEEKEESETAINEEEQADMSTQLNSIFGEDLSEEFKNKATSIFEAAVIARVNNEMDKITSRLEEQASLQLAEYKDTIVNKVDGYLSYVVEQWMEENSVAVETGLRAEIAEDFIAGLKNLFQEHYIEVPAEKYNVMDELQTTVSQLEAKLNESIEKNVKTSKELSELKQTKIFEEQTKDLAATEVEKLRKLVEGVEFESEDLFREKVSVIKENYFPKTTPKSPEKILVEESGTNPAAFETNSVMTKYVQSLSRTVKSR